MVTFVCRWRVSQIREGLCFSATGNQTVPCTYCVAVTDFRRPPHRPRLATLISFFRFLWSRRRASEDIFLSSIFFLVCFHFLLFFFNIPLEVESLDCLEIYEGLFSERNDRKIRGNIDRLFTFLLFFVLFYFILGKLGRWWSFRSWRTSFWSFSVKFSETEWYKINREKNIWEANLYYEVILSFKKCPAYSTASCYALSRICSSNAIVNIRFTRLGRKTYSREDT